MTSKPEKSLRARALEIVSRQEVSRSTLARKLAQYSDDADAVAAVVAEFAERNWQSDQRYAEAYIHSKSRLHGRLRLQQALTAQGVDRETVNTFLPDRDSETARAAAVLRKKFKQPPADRNERYRQMRFLAYRGFDSDTVQTALEQAWQSEED